MARFETVSLEQAPRDAKPRRRHSRIVTQYIGYIRQLKRGMAGFLQPGEGETLQVLRRRLGTAAKLSGKALVIKQAENQLYFWLQAPPTPRRRGEHPAEQQSGDATASSVTPSS